MNPSRIHQRGEGKVGCILSLLVLIVAVAAAVKIFPLYWNDNQLKDYADDVCIRAINIPADTLAKDIRRKAGELEIREALDAGGITVSKTGTSSGVCTVTLKYTHKVDLYGVFSFNIDVDKTLTHNYGIE